MAISTPAKAVFNIAIANQPTTLDYTSGQTLDLSGLSVTVTYNGGQAGKHFLCLPLAGGCVGGIHAIADRTACAADHLRAEFERQHLAGRASQRTGGFYLGKW